ncbi:polyprenyl synthetase family protein [Candidatus Bathyarchaeota archaeon]|nr:polyprenyl synthetase family protein [Candidatus Bathyarchaeota archaeon]
MTKKGLLEELRTVAESVNAFIEAHVGLPGEPEVLRESSLHAFKSGGKRWRPFVVLKACELLGGDPRRAPPVAAAVEILHNFTLIHDDIMDRDEFRRGLPTVHVLWGIPQAILTGDKLFAKVFKVLTDAGKASAIPSETILKIVDSLAQAALDICIGQTMDMLFGGRFEVSEEEYLSMIRGKTAALAKASAEVGALVGGGSSSEVQCLAKFGEEAGMAFQIVDDILGLTANEKELGKPVGSDIREGKKTLIIIHAFSKASPLQKARITRILGNRRATTEEIRQIIEELRALGSIEYAYRRSIEYSERAKGYLKSFPDKPAKDFLMELTDFFVKRNY